MPTSRTLITKFAVPACVAGAFNFTTNNSTGTVLVTCVSLAGFIGDTNVTVPVIV